LNPRHSLTKRIIEVRVSGRGFQVRVSYLLQQEISRHPVGLEHGDAAVTKCVQASRLQTERLEDQLQLAPHVMSGVWFPASGLKHSSRSSSREIRREHPHERRLDKHSSLPSLRLWRDCPALPDSTAHANEPGREIQILDLQASTWMTYAATMNQKEKISGTFIPLQLVLRCAHGLACRTFG